MHSAAQSATDATANTGWLVPNPPLEVRQHPRPGLSTSTKLTTATAVVASVVVATVVVDCEVAPVFVGCTVAMVVVGWLVANVVVDWVVATVVVF
jgi:hypothetical protein